MAESPDPGGITSSFCRDCLGDVGLDAHCPHCGSSRLLRHEELDRLGIAHLDCDAFYAAIEKRDNPELRDKPVLIGGTGRRGVVSTACYIARRYGPRSAMPMFKARKLCPDAVIIRPDMAKYQRVGRQIREMMRDLTPMVEPLSIDEAFLDLTGTERLHGMSPARSMARLTRRIEQEIGITVSVGLSGNKFLAKLASDLDKPRGFSVIGMAEAADFLSDKPVGLIWGVGKVLEARLKRDGITRIGQLAAMPQSELAAAYGAMGLRLYHLARGEDSRRVSPVSETKSISHETTFEQDIRDCSMLEDLLWPLCEDVARRAREADLSGRTAVLKLKTGDFRILTRNHTLDEPTQYAEVMFRALAPLLRKQATGRSFRLIGAGLTNLVPGSGGRPNDLLDGHLTKHIDAELAVAELRRRFGNKAVVKGRGMAEPDD
ncbi:MAG: DNA polymerase IV [Hyphomicrobiales bacterium]|nr:MAG: DNA polymerase IV [Hyphomicrobiales bacterium]